MSIFAFLTVLSDHLKHHQAALQLAGVSIVHVRPTKAGACLPGPQLCAFHGTQIINQQACKSTPHMPMYVAFKTCFSCRLCGAIGIPAAYMDHTITTGQTYCLCASYVGILASKKQQKDTKFYHTLLDVHYGLQIDFFFAWCRNPLYVRGYGIRMAKYLRPSGGVCCPLPFLDTHKTAKNNRFCTRIKNTILIKTAVNMQNPLVIR